MPAKKKATKKSADKATPITKDDFAKAGYTQTKSGRWVKNIGEYNRKVRDGVIDPDTGLRTGKADPKAKAVKTTKKAAKKPAKAKAKKAKAAKAPAEAAPAA